mmetsp:Transcript_1026/g.1915  ORF Transcript_1026/g.1915 Transcript_1026/m.1915 type:complete len:104 (-) Transcript_1026:260-571(-)
MTHVSHQSKCSMRWAPLWYIRTPYTFARSWSLQLQNRSSSGRMASRAAIFRSDGSGTYGDILETHGDIVEICGRFVEICGGASEARLGRRAVDDVILEVPRLS